LKRFTCLTLLLALTLVACAKDDKPLIPNQIQADHLKVLQLVAKDRLREILEAQRQYAPTIKALTDYCTQIARENRWPAGTTCSAQTAANIDQLFGQDVSFARPAPTETKKTDVLGIIDKKVEDKKPAKK
jgi:hypothetical protein